MQISNVCAASGVASDQSTTLVTARLPGSGVDRRRLSAVLTIVLALCCAVRFAVTGTLTPLPLTLQPAPGLDSVTV